MKASNPDLEDHSSIYIDIPFFVVHNEDALIIHLYKGFLFHYISETIPNFFLTIFKENHITHNLQRIIFL